VQRQGERGCRSRGARQIPRAGRRGRRTSRAWIGGGHRRSVGPVVRRPGMYEMHLAAKCGCEICLRTGARVGRAGVVPLGPSVDLLQGTHCRSYGHSRHAVAGSAAARAAFEALVLIFVRGRSPTRESRRGAGRNPLAVRRPLRRSHKTESERARGGARTKSEIRTRSERGFTRGANPNLTIC